MKVLLTGATGLLGTVLLRELAERGHEVLAAVRDRGDLSSWTRLDRIATALSVPRARVRLIHAPTPEGFAASLHGISSIDAVVHAAASVKFGASRGSLFEQNVVGTSRILDLATHMAPGADFHFVSTAYVRPLTGPGARQRNDYEESKCAAEALVRQRCQATGRAHSVLRPSIIGGATSSGVCANFNGVLALLRLLGLARANGFDRGIAEHGVAIHCAPDATKNIVPVDWVARAIAETVEAGADDQTYDLTHPAPVTHTSFLKSILDAVGLSGVRISPEPIGSAPQSPVQRLFDRSLSCFDPYLWAEPEFDRGPMERRFRHMPPPPLVDRRYVERLMRFGDSINWRPYPLEQPQETPITNAERDCA